MKALIGTRECTFQNMSLVASRGVKRYDAMHALSCSSASGNECVL
eukprot:CAMPEP_0206546660 /NCGR_PEP_ID=MMETSP0325_2-20121206/12843_1 /ASSEMBLY_ACC=CAM_ASM_000347 /TAXON_ID=2866 /ORGANISM="Crypthecodinium cohnii, Strain Seligo" /LENGTH=44 /DNA_ID= /DNA_START= /DNA_END= /DNA_ORIENTATION=